MPDRAKLGARTQQGRDDDLPGARTDMAFTSQLIAEDTEKRGNRDRGSGFRGHVFSAGLTVHSCLFTLHRRLLATDI